MGIFSKAFPRTPLSSSQFSRKVLALLIFNTAILTYFILNITQARQDGSLNRVLLLLFAALVIQIAVNLIFLRSCKGRLRDLGLLNQRGRIPIRYFGCLISPLFGYLYAWILATTEPGSLGWFRGFFLNRWVARGVASLLLVSTFQSFYLKYKCGKDPVCFTPHTQVQLPRLFSSSSGQYVSWLADEVQTLLLLKSLSAQEAIQKYRERAQSHAVDEIGMIIVTAVLIPKLMESLERSPAQTASANDPTEIQAIENLIESVEITEKSQSFTRPFNLMGFNILSGGVEFFILGILNETIKMKMSNNFYPTFQSFAGRVATKNPSLSTSLNERLSKTRMAHYFQALKDPNQQIWLTRLFSNALNHP